MVPGADIEAVEGLMQPGSNSNTSKAARAFLDAATRSASPIALCSKCDAQQQEAGDKLQRCTGCWTEVYCGRRCQAAHWKRHKATCTRLQKYRAQQRQAVAPRPVLGAAVQAALTLLNERLVVQCLQSPVPPSQMLIWVELADLGVPGVAMMAVQTVSEVRSMLRENSDMPGYVRDMGLLVACLDAVPAAGAAERAGGVHRVCSTLPFVHTRCTGVQRLMQWKAAGPLRGVVLREALAIGGMTDAELEVHRRALEIREMAGGCESAADEVAKQTAWEYFCSQMQGHA